MKRHVLAACLLSLAAATSLGGALAGTGAVIYRANPQVFEDSGIAAPGSLVPVKLTLPSKTGVLVNAGDVLSAPAVATGPDAGFLLVARGGELRACSSADCSSGGSFSSSIRAANGGYVQARLAGPTTVGGVNRMTVESGSYTGTFEVSATSDAGLEPVADVVNAEPGSLQISTASTLKGFASTTLSVTGGEYRLNGGSWTSASSTAKAGDKVEIRVAAGAFGTAKTATVVVAGGSSISFTASARGQDTLPDPFTVASATNAAPGAQVVSAAVTPTGFEGTVAISATGGEVSVAGGAYAASGTIALGQSFTVRLAASAAFGATTTAQVTVGSSPAVPFSVATRAKDTTPDAVAFVALTGQTAAAEVLSEIVALTGHDGVALSVAGTGSSLRTCTTATCVGGTVGTWTTSTSDVVAGTYVQLKQVVGAAGEKRTASLAYGTLTATWDVTAASGQSLRYGNLYAVGSNSSYQLGNGTTVVSTPTATKVALPTGVTALAAPTSYYQSACATGSDAALYCWGNNSFGQLGDGTTTNRNVPTKVVLPTGVTALKDASAGLFDTCATGSDGAVYCWGRNEYGQIGDGTSTDRTTPTKVKFPTGVSMSKVLLANRTTCGIGTDLQAYCWGYNAYGQLGNGTTDGASQATKVPNPSGTTGFKEIMPTNYAACGIASNDAAYCWGNNDYGQAGDGTSGGNKLSPVKVTFPAGVTKFSGIQGGVYSNCAMGDDGAAYCWGDNGSGQIGDGTTTQRNTPVKVTVPSGATWIKVTDVGSSRSCGVASDGHAYCWGYNSYGSVGTGSASPSNVLVPTRMALPSGVADFDAPVTSWDTTYAIAK